MSDAKPLQRYECRTLGNGTDYCPEPDDDGPWCNADDVEVLQARVRELEKVNLNLKQVWDEACEQRDATGLRNEAFIEDIAKLEALAAYNEAKK